MVCCVLTEFPNVNVHVNCARQCQSIIQPYIQILQIHTVAHALSLSFTDTCMSNQNTHFAYCTHHTHSTVWREFRERAAKMTENNIESERAIEREINRSEGEKQRANERDGWARVPKRDTQTPGTDTQRENETKAGKEWEITSLVPIASTCSNCTICIRT